MATALVQCMIRTGSGCRRRARRAGTGRSAVVALMVHLSAGLPEALHRRLERFRSFRRIDTITPAYGGLSYLHPSSGGGAMVSRRLLPGSLLGSLLLGFLLAA